jgi:hypothetical protein
MTRRWQRPFIPGRRAEADAGGDDAGRRPYAPGSWGPDAARDLIAPDHWLLGQ